MSFDDKLFSMDLMPKKSKKRKAPSAKAAAKGFESPGFFGGLQVPRSSIPKVDRDEGLKIPPLGEEFNTRFGKVGSGLVENVDTFKVGFKDVLTGNGRTGEIIGSGAKLKASSGRGRGRPRKAGRRSTGTRTKKQEGKTIGAVLAGAATSGIKKGASALKQKIQDRNEGKFQSQSIDLGEAEGRSLRVTQEGQGVSFEPEEVRRFKGEEAEEGGVTFADVEEKDLDLTDEEVEEEDEEILDKDMAKEEEIK